MIIGEGGSEDALVVALELLGLVVAGGLALSHGQWKRPSAWG